MTTAFARLSAYPDGRRIAHSESTTHVTKLVILGKETELDVYLIDPQLRPFPEYQKARYNIIRWASLCAKLRHSGRALTVESLEQLLLNLFVYIPKEG